MKRRREEGSDKQSTHSSLLLLHCAILPRGMLIHMLAHGGGGTCHAIQGTYYTYKRAVRHFPLFSPPRSSPFSHVLLCRAELFHWHSAQRDQEPCSVPCMYSTRILEVCVCSHARPAGPTLSFSPPSEVAGGPLPNGVIQRSR